MGMKALLRMLLLICMVVAPWGALPLRASIPAAAAVANYQGLWWNPQESGWGINFAHQGDIVFATWFTYDAAGKPWWLIAVLARSADGVYAGPVSTVAGPLFGSVPFGPAPVETEVGTMTATFADTGHATIAYTVNGVAQTKTIVPQAFGALATCVWGAQDNLALATNYQDLWWNPQESGWGVNFTHQGDVIFATWFTYDGQGKPWWLIAVLAKSAAGVYAGPVSTVGGPPFDSVPWGAVAEAEIGSASVTFSSGNAATFAYTVNGTTQTKSITRQVFAAPGTVCHASGEPFEMKLSAQSLLLLPGAMRDVYVTVTPRNGFTGTVALTASGLPAGVGYQISPAAVTLGASAVSAVLRLTVADGAAPTASPAIAMVGGQGGGAGSSMVGLAVGVAAAGDPVATRLAAIAAVEDEARQLGSQNLAPAAFLQAISAFMAARPEYKAAGVDVEALSAWGRFSDGRLHLVAANRDPSPAALATANRATAKSGELPKATKARLLHSFGPNFEGQAPVDQMRGYLQGKDWTVRGGGEGVADVGTLKGVTGDGFFYINTHGGRMEVDDPSEPDGKLYSIQSSTLVDAGHENGLAADLQALRLVHFTARNGDQISVLGLPLMPDWDTRYGITYRFVDAYMSFASGSVVLINACWSSRNASFTNAFLRKGAGVYLGWSEKLSSGAAYASAPYLVDRMLGANQHPDKESPPQRAFPYDLVLQDMAKKGLDTDAATGGKLQATMKPGLPQPPIFAPSIRYAQVDEYGGLLTLVGEFSADQPKVTIGGTEVTPKSWSAGEIVATLPANGAGSSGDVVVELRNVKSNARQLTEWSIALKYLWDRPYSGYPGQKFEGSGKVRIRADIGGYRLAPAGAIQYKARGGAAAKDTVLDLTASGTYTTGGCTYRLDGAASYVSPIQANGAMVPILGNAFRLAGDSKQAALGLAFGFSQSPHVVTITGNSGCGVGTWPIAPAFGLLDGVINFPQDQSDEPATYPLPGIAFALDASYGIPAVTRAAPLGGHDKADVSWTATPANSPPRDGVDAGK